MYNFHCIVACRFVIALIIKKKLTMWSLTFVLAEVGWFMSHPEKPWYPEHLEVWCLEFSQVSFISVQRIHSQCLTVQYKVRFRHGKDKVHVTIPLIGRFCW